MKKIFLLLLCLLLIGTVTAQEDNNANAKKPKIGVVLSGGGAKGLAHIGVLKVLEEAGIKVDYIGGTSMGAIVGGLYAAGYSAQELDSIFNSLDADALIQDFTPRGSKNFFEKRNDELYALSLPFKGFKISFPTAFSKGLYNYTTVSRLTDNVRQVRDFDSLPIPFVCIATDIETGEEVVLRKGVLPDAILASGAFPSLYYPVEINGRLLIDGGVTNNYPIEEVRKMGADIIIGVDVQDGLKDRTEIKGATGVLVQINNYQMIKKMEVKRKATDVYIKPDITNYTVISFDDGRQIIDEGEKAARAMLDSLKILGTGKPIVRDNVCTEDTLTITQIEIAGLKNYSRAYVIGKLNFKPGSTISYNKLNNGISNLNATQNFNAIAYNFTQGKRGDILNLRMTENPINRYLKFGLHYDGLYKSGVLVNFTQKNLFRRGDVASLDVILGDNFRYMFNYYMDNGFYTSYGLRSTFNSFNRNVPGSIIYDMGVNSANVDYTDINNQIYVQTIFAQKFLLGGGAELKHLKIKSETLSSDRSRVFDNSDYFSVYGYLKFDSYDKRYFPTKGGYFAGEAKSFLYSSDYTGDFDRFSIIKAEMGTAKRIYRNFTLELQAESGITIGEENVTFFDFILGGYGYNMINNFRHFYGYDFISISGNSYIKGVATLDWEFIRKNHLNVTANFANVGQNLLDEGNILSLPQYTGYAVGYGMESIIGPLELKHSWSPDTNRHYTWISIGFWF
ncbi:patatin [Flavobacterium salilacus subsp. salilacus]|uniref:patatin-like phospholipase family protein n=1 Tax=Flavobacterium TaxID=237 RepID=UPI00107512E3|nr:MULTISPECIES: patatin-like phospholipase family protein [Flavobacterium]KAF2518288.1 patatin [Flavobacterium salilacus subsp. salilacus]MBE1615300.1 patatin-like phospholipase family protein [Flavobacterium sp. SaA2.13]